MMNELTTKDEYDSMMNEFLELRNARIKSGQLHDEMLEKAILNMTDDMRARWGLKTPKKTKIILLR